MSRRSFIVAVLVGSVFTLCCALRSAQAQNEAKQVWDWFTSSDWKKTDGGMWYASGDFPKFITRYARGEAAGLPPTQAEFDVRPVSNDSITFSFTGGPPPVSRTAELFSGLSLLHFVVFGFDSDKRFIGVGGAKVGVSSIKGNTATVTMPLNWPNGSSRRSALKYVVIACAPMGFYPYPYDFITDRFIPTSGGSSKSINPGKLDSGSPSGSGASTAKFVKVNADNEKWTDTGRQIKSGDTLVIEARGSATYGLEGDPINDRPETDPDGNRRFGGKAFGKKIDGAATMPSVPIGSLIGCIKDDSGRMSAPFLIGSQFKARINRAGRLFLLYNDVPGFFDDNTGSYTVEVSVE